MPVDPRHTALFVRAPRFGEVVIGTDVEGVDLEPV